MSKLAAYVLLAVACAVTSTLLFMRITQTRAAPASAPASIAAPAVQDRPSRPAVKDLKAGMVIDGATVLKTADLIVDWKKWRGQSVIIRGTAFSASDRNVAFSTNNVVLQLSRMDSETRRWFMKECYGAFVNPDCNGLTIMGVPEDGQFAREIANVTIIR